MHIVLNKLYMLHLKTKFVFDIQFMHKLWNNLFPIFANVYYLISKINNLSLFRLKLVKQNVSNVNVGAMVKTNCTNCFGNMQCRLHIAVGLLFAMQFYLYELHYKFNGKFYQPAVSKICGRLVWYIIRIFWCNDKC